MTLEDIYLSFTEESEKNNRIERIMNCIPGAPLTISKLDSFKDDICINNYAVMRFSRKKKAEIDTIKREGYVFKKAIATYVVKWWNKETDEELYELLPKIFYSRENIVFDSLINKGYEKNIMQQQQELKQGICPRCGGTLVERDGQYGKFYGCSNYPKCRFILNKK